MSPTRKVGARRAADRQRAARFLAELQSGVDIYQNYRAWYSLCCRNNAAVQELEPLFCIPGVEPDGGLSINEEFRRTVSRVAGEILAQSSDLNSGER